MHRLKGTPDERRFLTEVIRRSGQNLLECLQCGRCTASCPISSPTVGGPRRLIAQIHCDMRAEALRDPTWWYCVSCGTCANRCPVEINMYQVATTLCEMAEEAGIEPSEPAIHLFEELFLKSVRRHGRVRELSTVMRYNLQMRRPFQDAGKGLRLMLKGAISPLGMMGGGRKDPVVERIFTRSATVEQGETDHEG
jgi:heterodisulfide reductase subunit C